MKRTKRQKRKENVILGVLWTVFVLLCAAALLGLYLLASALFAPTVGGSYYADLAKSAHIGDAVDFSALSAANSDVKAWVALSGTAIDLPIVQTADNETYLTRIFNGKRNKLGTPFLDASNASDFSDRHTVIYGHALKSGAMLGALWEYENPNYLMRHPALTLFLPDGTQKTLSVFACARVGEHRSDIPISFGSDEAFEAFLDELRELSAFESNVSVTASDRVVSFCVCLPDGGTGRLLVSCKLENEEANAVTLPQAESTDPAVSPDLP